MSQYINVEDIDILMWLCVCVCVWVSVLDDRTSQVVQSVFVCVSVCLIESTFCLSEDNRQGSHYRIICYFYDLCHCVRLHFSLVSSTGCYYFCLSCCFFCLHFTFVLVVCVFFFSFFLYWRVSVRWSNGERRRRRGEENTSGEINK